MASVSTTYPYPYQNSREYLAPVLPQQSKPLPSRFTSSCKAKATLLLRQILSMASCSQQSRKVLVVLRGQLAVTLELGELTPSTSQISKDSIGDYTSIVSCTNCEGFMVQPVCLPCGHSICKGCTEKSNVADSENLTCPNCNQVCSKLPQRHFEEEAPDLPARQQSIACRAPTLIIQNAFRKWYPNWVESCRCREEGNMYANRGDLTSAVKYYSQALETGVCDYRVLGNRSRAYLALDNLSNASQDAELACRLRPFWAKGHYRRACVLEKQGRWCEAVAAYLLCLNFGGNDQTVIKSACQLIDQNIKGLSETAARLSASAAVDTTPFSSTGSELQLSDVVRVAVSKMVECVSFSVSTGEEMNAVVSPVAPERVDRSDFECVLCTGLLHNPITTSCGHSFCQMCICRSFDHSTTCPICRSMLSETFKQHCQNLGKLNTDVILEGLLLHYFKDVYLAKKAQQKVEFQRTLRAGTSETEYLPVFVCTVAYPTLSCPLHIFEPRYRLMIRRCMENGSKRFGMCPSASEESFASYGTVVCINSVQSMEDGRFLISSTGERRFQVMGRGMMDGYHVAQIIFLFDERVTDQAEIATLRSLQEEVYTVAKKWLEGLPFLSKLMMMQVVSTQFPEMYSIPECCPNGPEWVWWLVHACPISPTKKLDFLKCTSLWRRLQMVKDLLKSAIFTSTSS